MKLNINSITLFTVTLVLCFAICTSHVPPSVEEPPPESPPPPPKSPHPPPKSPPRSPKSPPPATKSPPRSPKSPPPATKSPPRSPKSPPPATKSPPPAPKSRPPPAADPPSSFPQAPKSPPQAADPPFSFPPTEFSNTEEPVPTEEGFFNGGGGRGGGSGHLRSAFSSFFAEIRGGSLRGSKTITMLKHFNHHDSDSVKKICSHTDYPDECLSTVVPFLNRKFDLINVLEASIKACSFQANFTISVVVKHMKSSPDMARALAGCKEQYTNALQSLHQAMEALASHDIGTVTIMLSSVMADVSACESSFEDLKVALPKGRAEGMVSITASNCLSIASMIPS